MQCCLVLNMITFYVVLKGIIATFESVSSLLTSLDLFCLIEIKCALNYCKFARN